MSDVILYDYWRSSASYRVRIALNLLGITYDAVPVDLLTKAHLSPEHVARNPQGLVPALAIDGRMLSQSLAIMEYLAETRGDKHLIPDDIDAKTRIRTLSYAIAMDIHPICNLNVVAHVMEITGEGDQARLDWMQRFIGHGLAGFEALLDHQATGDFCHGDQPSMADCCLVPQIFNANRWGVDVSGFTAINRIMANCAKIPAFTAAHPDEIGAP